MQFLNNDMDNLMRHAAEGFDPGVTGANWEAVAQKLDEEAPQTPGLASHSRRYGLLFLFLLSSLVCNKYLFLKFNQWGALNASIIEQHRKNYGPVNISEEGKKGLEVVSKQKVSKNLLVQNVSKPFYALKKISRLQTEDVPVIAANKWDEREEKVNTTTDENLMRRQSFLERRGLLSTGQPFQNLILKNSKLNFASPVPSPVEKIKQQRFYAGPVAALDFSTVKFQQWHTGWQGGLLLGYQVTKKWAVEAGVLWAKKSYYAEGKDFSTSKITLPTHSTILHAEGYCNMFEIPLQIKYDFVNGKQQNLFVTIGASSYLMQKEEYDYLYERYNVEYYSNKYYKTSSKHFMATINLSAGYQHKIGRGALRVEPYLKLPVQKMGVGSLPITSAGLQAGFTYPIR